MIRSFLRPTPFRASLTAAALVPVLLLGTTGPAVAATNTLTLTAINRSGVKVAVAATAVNLASSSEYKVRAGGKTWRAVPVKKISGVWTAVVPNPNSGAVSLRTRATYTSGGYTEVTVHRAYAIG